MSKKQKEVKKKKINIKEDSSNEKDKKSQKLKNKNLDSKKDFFSILFSKQKNEDSTEKSKTKNDKKNSPFVKKVKKHHVWGLGGVIFGIIIALLIVILFGMKFITSIKTDSYVEGGRDALREVFNSVNDKGGLILNFEGESIIIAKYNKETNLNETFNESEAITDLNDSVS